MPATKSKRRDQQSQGRINEWIAIARREWPTTLLLVLGLPLLWLDLFQPPIAPLVPQPRIIVVRRLLAFPRSAFNMGEMSSLPMVHLAIWFRPFTQVSSFSSGCYGNWLAKPIFVLVLGFVLDPTPKFWRPFLFFFVLLFIRADGPSDALYFLVISYHVSPLQTWRDQQSTEHFRSDVFRHRCADQIHVSPAGRSFSDFGRHLLLRLAKNISSNPDQRSLSRNIPRLLADSETGTSKPHPLFHYFSRHFVRIQRRDVPSAGDNMIVITGAFVVILGFIQCLLLF